MEKVISRRKFLKNMAMAGGSTAAGLLLAEYLLERGYLDDLALAGAYIRDKSRFHGRGSLLLRRLEAYEVGGPFDEDPATGP